MAGNLTGVRYKDEILRPVVVPFVQQHHIIFQQDNARPHVARVCQDFLANHSINPLDWPPYSPDLFPIEHLWDKWSDELHAQENQGFNRCARGGGGIRDIDELIDFILTYWGVLLNWFQLLMNH